MATISLKNAPDDLTDSIRLAAAHARVTAREYILNALQTAVSRDLGHAVPDPHIKKAVASAAAPVMPASSLPPVSRLHDVDSCRLRGCGMCAALGVQRD